MRIITVCSHKGGVGKTTTSLNLGLSLANSGHRTLVVDLDPQGAIGLSLAQERSHLPGVAEILTGRLSVQDAIVQTRRPTLSLLPVGRIRMRQTALFDKHLEDGKKLRAIFASVSDRFDIVIIDTPAGFGGATLGALRASTDFVSPLAVDPLALRGAPEVLELAVWLLKSGYDVQFLGFIATFVDYSEPESTAVLLEARERFGSDWMFETVIRRDAEFLRASAAGVPIASMRQRPGRVALAFDQLARELEMKLEPSAESEDYEPISLLD